MAHVYWVKGPNEERGGNGHVREVKGGERRCFGTAEMTVACELEAHGEAEPEAEAESEAWLKVLFKSLEEPARG